MKTENKYLVQADVTNGCYLVELFTPGQVICANYEDFISRLPTLAYGAEICVELDEYHMELLDDEYGVTRNQGGY